jgi:hypothetical protein
MVTATKIKNNSDLIPVAETEEYPPEVIDNWKKEIEITKLQIKTGEIKYKPLDELAADFGINVNDL